MSEDAVARAKAIAARLAGMSGAAPAMTASALPPAPAAPQAPVMVDKATADAAAAALEAAFGGAPPAATPSPAPVPTTAGSGGKRKRWGADSSAASAPAVADAALGGEDKRPRPLASAVEDALAAALSAGGAAKAQKKIVIPTERNPGYNYVGLLIGPGGSKQRELVERAGGRVKISIRGGSKGSGGSGAAGAPGGGGDDEPLHVLLEGDSDCVTKAEGMITELLENTDKADAEKGRQLAEVKAQKLGGTPVAANDAGGTDGHYGPAAGSDNAGSGASAQGSGSTYAPKPVAHLIGAGASPYGPSAGGPTLEEKIGVPNGVVGYLIGRGGESIARMQRQSGCRVQIQKEHEMEPGSTQRVITLTAGTAEAISNCRGIIEAMVSERLRTSQGPGGGGMGGGGMGGGGVGAGVASAGPGANAAAQAQQLQRALAEGHALVKVKVPNADVGLVIGRGGATIRSMQERSGANIQIPPGPDQDDPSVRTVHVTHPQKEGAEFAQRLIEDVLKDRLQGIGGARMGGAPGGMGGGGGRPGEQVIQIQVPDKDVGMCIGRGGCVIKEMQIKTGTKIQIPSQPVPGQGYRIATVSGPPENCDQVKQMIDRIIMEQSSQSVMTGAAFTGSFAQGQQQGMYGQYGQQQGAYGQQYGAYGTQQQQAGAYGQAAQQGSGQKTDYSAEWAAYYAQQAASQQGGGTSGSSAAAPAPAPGAPAPAPGASGAPAPASGSSSAQSQQPAADAYYDAFFRYAVYYGEEAARQYYGAWSPPAGTPNPYATGSGGVAGGAGAPSAASPSSGQAKQSSLATAPSDVVDSSARAGVSNLPAWMTKQG